METINNSKTVYEEFVNQINKLKEDSPLKEYLCGTCTSQWTSVLNRRIEIWLEHNDPVRVNDYLHCLFGIPFEYYVVETIDHIKIDGFNPWNFISWRSDKFIGSSDSDTFPASNSYPDLLYEYAGNSSSESGFEEGDRIAIECKWTDLAEESTVEACAVKKVKDCTFYLENSLIDRACCFYLAIGVGWDDNTSKPMAVYFVPTSAIKDINSKSINKYKMEETGILKFNKIESLISNSINKKTITDTINEIHTHLHNLADSLGIQFPE